MRGLRPYFGLFEGLLSTIRKLPRDCSLQNRKCSRLGLKSLNPDFVIVLGTPLYLEKYQNLNEDKGTIVAAEMDLINQRLTASQEAKESIIGLNLLSVSPRAN